MNLRYYKREETEQKQGLHPAIIVILILFVLFLIVVGVKENNPFMGFIYIRYLFESLFGLVGSLFTQKIRY